VVAGPPISSYGRGRLSSVTAIRVVRSCPCSALRLAGVGISQSRREVGATPRAFAFPAVHPLRTGLFVDPVLSTRLKGERITQLARMANHGPMHWARRSCTGGTDAPIVHPTSWAFD